MMKFAPASAIYVVMEAVLTMFPVFPNNFRLSHSANALMGAHPAGSLSFDLTFLMVSAAIDMLGMSKTATSTTKSLIPAFSAFLSKPVDLPGIPSSKVSFFFGVNDSGAELCRANSIYGIAGIHSIQKKPVK